MSMKGYGASHRVRRIRRSPLALAAAALGILLSTTLRAGSEPADAGQADSRKSAETRAANAPRQGARIPQEHQFAGGQEPVGSAKAIERKVDPSAIQVPPG